jgi:predicted GNAT superfamily acetyltransferase
MAAALAAGVEVCRVTTPEEAAEVRDLFTAVWGRAEEPVVTAELLRVVAFVGGYVHAAYAGGEDGPMVGAALALPTLEGRSPRAGLHSHAAAVLPGHRAGVGFALKVDQRAWALDRGLWEITWTFDPLIRRNAHFNLAKLAAEPAAYLVDFYGEMHDDINAGQGSDRLLLRWDLVAAQVADACTGVPWSPPVPPDARTALAVDADGGPTAMAWNGTAGALLVHVPPDVETMRRRAPRQAVAWRHAVREVLAGLMTDGWAVTGFVERRAYLLRRPGSVETTDRGSAP